MGLGRQTGMGVDDRQYRGSVAQGSGSWTFGGKTVPRTVFRSASFHGPDIVRPGRLLAIIAPLRLHPPLRTPAAQPKAQRIVNPTRLRRSPCSVSRRLPDRCGGICSETLRYQTAGARSPAYRHAPNRCTSREPARPSGQGPSAYPALRHLRGQSVTYFSRLFSSSGAVSRRTSSGSNLALNHGRLAENSSRKRSGFQRAE